MSKVQVVQDGKMISTSASETSLSSKEAKNGSTLDKDAFLQLLVAQMKYQDPLEPTSNTEYISQFATFSSLEQMQNMGTSVDMERATGLVGKEVFLSVTNKSGNTETIYGKVDYVTLENGDIFLSVNNELYSLEDLETVVDPEYWEAYNLSGEWLAEVAKLPKLTNVTAGDTTAINALKKAYEGMTDYQKTFITSANKEILDTYVKKLEEVSKTSSTATNTATGTTTA